MRMLTTRENMIVCLEPPCHRRPRYFPDLSSYEQHHKQFHTLVCLECHLHFPTERILSIHLEERHDPFVEAQRARHSYKVSPLSLLRPLLTSIYVTYLSLVL